MISNYSPLQSVSYSALPVVSAGGRAYIPVERTQAIYSHFKYVSGVPAKDGERGLTVDKLNILNTIIDQLMHMKTSELNKGEGGEVNKEESDSARIDGLIEYYRSEIKKLRLQGRISVMVLRYSPQRL